MPEIKEFSRTPEVLNHPESALVNMDDLERFQNFTGVKMGDIDLSVDRRGFTSTQVRSKGISITKSDQKIDVGQLVELKFTSSDLENGEATFLNFDLENESLELVNVIDNGSAKASVYQKDGRLAISIYSANEEYEVSLQFRSNIEGKLSDVLGLSKVDQSRTITSEFEVSNIDLVFSELTFVRSMEINPNPIQGDALISYLSDQQKDISLDVFSSDGRLVLSRKLQAEKGLNSYRIDKASLKNESSIIFISITHGKGRLLSRAVMMH